MATLLFAPGCGSDGAATTTTTSQIAAPTRPTTNAPPTSAPATTSLSTSNAAPLPPTASLASATAPPTAVRTDPAEAVKNEAAARYEEFSVAANECVAVAAACDLPTVLGQFASSDAALYQLYLNRWEISVANHEHSEQLDRIERSVVVVEVDQGVAILVACVVDGSVVVDGSGEIVDDGIGYRREETVWKQEGTVWRLVGGTTYRLDEEGDNQCRF